MPDIDWKLADKVAKRLDKCGQYDAKPVAITIGRTTYIGATYLEPESGDKRIYLLGNVPPSYRRGAVYRLPDDDGDWYVAVYMEPGRINAAVRQYHPFGGWFGLHRWPHEELGPMDAKDDRTRSRMTITIEEGAYA